MKIFVIEPRGSGGMAHYACQLCDALHEAGSQVTLVTARHYELDDFPYKFRLMKTMNLWSNKEPYQVERDQNRLLHLIWIAFRSFRRGVRGIRYILEWFRLTGIILRERPDIIQFGEIEFPFEALFLQYLRSRGCVLTQICHEFEPRERSDNLFTRFNNRLLKNVFNSFSAIFFHSTSSLQRFKNLYPGIPTERLHLIAMGNADIFTKIIKENQTEDELLKRYGFFNENKVVLFFGNLTPSKGIPDLLESFALVHEKEELARLVIAGMPLKYIHMDSLVSLASRLSISAFTNFDTRYLPITEVPQLMDLAAVVVFPYLSSTQSASIQVAYALGKPVIATRVGGLPDLVEDGKSGLLVEPHAPDQLASAILRILGDPELAKEMGSYGRLLSETRFSWESIASEIINVYQGILINQTTD